MASLKEQAVTLFQKHFKAYTSESAYIRAKLLEIHGFNNWANKELSARGNSNAFWEAVIKWCPTTSDSDNIALGKQWESEIDAMDEQLSEDDAQNDEYLDELNEVQEYVNGLDEVVATFPNEDIPSYGWSIITPTPRLQLVRCEHDFTEQEEREAIQSEHLAGDAMASKAKRASVQIAGIQAEVFQMPNGGYVMSQTQVAGVVGKSESYVRQYLSEKRLEGRLYKDYTPVTFETENNGNGKRGSSRIKPVPIAIASDFWMSQAFKGNVKAQALVAACTQETLQRRCDNVFGVAKTEQQYEHQSSVALSQWQEARVKLRETHNAFTNACARYGFSAALAHDKLTKAICNKSAKELREMELINGQWDIGLNHLDDLQDIKRVARMKYHFSRYRKGTVDERVTKAKKDVLKENDAL